jgi:hypothetical protein
MGGRLAALRRCAVRFRLNKGCQRRRRPSEQDIFLALAKACRGIQVSAVSNIRTLLLANPTSEIGRLYDAILGCQKRVTAALAEHEAAFPDAEVVDLIDEAVAA